MSSKIVAIIVLFALTSLGITLGAVMYHLSLPEELDYALAIDGESKDEYLGEFILKAEIYDFSYKIITLQENLDNYIVKNLVIVSDKTLNFENLNTWIKDIDPVNLIADVNLGNALRPLYIEGPSHRF